MQKVYTLEPTKHPYLFRVMDMDGNWTHYLYRSGSEEKYLRAVNFILEKGYPREHNLDRRMLNTRPESRFKVFEEYITRVLYSCEKGRSIHRLLDEMIQQEEVPSCEQAAETNRQKAIVSFVKFWEAHDPEIIVSEYPVFNLVEGTAGTLDAVVRIRKTCNVRICECRAIVGKIGIWDWKTGNSINPEHSAQLGAYANAENINSIIPARMTEKEFRPFGENTTMPVSVRENKIEYGAILRIGTDHITTGGYQMRAFVGPALDEAYTRFGCAKVIADFTYKPFQPEIVG